MGDLHVLVIGAGKLFMPKPRLRGHVLIRERLDWPPPHSGTETGTVQVLLP
jgi:hypothetical protein